MLKVKTQGIGARLLDALDLGYDAEINKAKATIEIYVTNPAGIGEHPQHLEEIDKLLDTIATAEDKKEALSKHFEWRAPNLI